MKFLYSIFYLLLIHIGGLLMLSLLRLVFFLSLMNQSLPESQGQFLLQSTAFLRGVWFDNVVLCYVLILPLFVLCVASFFRHFFRGIWRGVAVYIVSFYILVFAVTTSNIPYFSYFFKIINSSIFNWVDEGGAALQMIVGESSYYPYIFLFFCSSAAFIIYVYQITHRMESILAHVAQENLNLKGYALVSLGSVCCLSLCLLGIRGRLGYNPIKVSAAYYCKDPFLNQLGVNPAFNLLTSTIDEHRKENKGLHLLPDALALQTASSLLGRGKESLSPIARIVPADLKKLKVRPNVVLIFMESLSANLMQRFGQEKRLTPFLDSLYTHSYSFSNLYSAGIHTNHGLYATLYSFPAIMKRNAMKGSVIPSYSGLPTVLKDNGYCNLFFMTHESQYDNMNAFFRTNGYDEIYSQENYPKSKVVNSFGVQDDFLYEYALQKLNEKARTGQPFFATLLSVSNHPPYVIPSSFHPKTRDKETQIVEYADDALRRLFAEASRQSWYQQTLFVLVGDHGKMVGDADSEMPQSYNHVPLIFSASWLPKGENAGFGGQIDIAPTLLSMLGIGYVQNNFGVDLQKEKRPCIFYTADNMIGVRDSAYTYMYSPDSEQEYFYENRDGRLKSVPINAHLQRLKTYGFSMLQAAEALVKQGNTRDRKNIKGELK